MARRFRVLVSAFTLALAAGCTSSTSSGPQPGSTPPGQACVDATDCYCWECTCTGVSGAPGAAQICLSNVCPTGAQACAPTCALADAGFVSATSVDSCEGRPE